MTNKIINSIEKQLYILTKKKFSKKYIHEYIIPIIDFIISSKKKKFLISGSQGIGKSTLLKVIEENIKIFYKKKVLTLSLDDYYLTKKERLKLSKKFHPLLLTRGVPGTHNIKKLFNHIEQFDKSKYPIKLTIFDKLNDDCSKNTRIIRSHADILILEGWCCGCAPINKKFLMKNINDLEKEKDRDHKWRTYYNEQLMKEYAKLFKLFDKTIFLKVPSFLSVLKWRIKQEKMMGIDQNVKKIMSNKDIFNFISYYEKITKWMRKTLPSKAHLMIEIDKNQKIKKIIYNK